jgi:hypothetical protein
MGDEKVKVSIIIPHYNQKECLQRLFPNLVDQTYKDFEVIVIDDCTPDDATVPFIKELIKDKPNMQLVQNTVNLRFVKTCNKGIKLAKGEYLCFLNQDTEIKSNFVQRNVEIFESDATIGGLTSVVLDKSGENWFSGGRYSEGFPINLEDDFQGVRSVDFIAGTAAFYRREVFDKIGLFDENYIMYHEDVEFGLRVKQLTDYRLCTFSEKLVTHLILKGMKGINVFYYGYRNQVLLSRKYAPQYLPKLIGHIILERFIEAFRSILDLDPLTSLFKLRNAFNSILAVIDGLMVRQTQSICTDVAKPR